MLTTDDKLSIAETLSMHGHLFDEGRLDRLDELFTEDVIYDVSDLGGAAGRLEGIEACRDAALALGSDNPLAHIVTNIVITEGDEPDTARAHSKGIVVLADRGAGTATYDDLLVRTPAGWRIRSRKILARREPLGGVAGGGAVIPPGTPG